MSEFRKFIFGHYWNDTDSRATGYRIALAFAWFNIIVASTGIVTVAAACIGWQK